MNATNRARGVHSAARPALPEPGRLRPGEFFGRPLRARSLGGFVLTDARYPPELQVPEHSHARPFLCLLVGGGYSETLGGVERVAHKPGSVVYHPAREVHSGRIAGSGGRCLHLEIGERESGSDDSAPLPSAPKEFSSGPLTWLAMRLYREFAEERAASALVMEGIALEILGLLVRGDGDRAESVPPWVSRVAERLHDQLEEPLTVKGMAADLGVSAIRLSREFRRAHGEGIGEMHRRLKVERACRLLGETTTPLAELALELGFADQSHLTRVFRGFTGLTPAAYRRLLLAR